MSERDDRVLKCADCGEEFTFSAGEQAFYAERGFQQPKRCKSCQKSRRDQREDSGENRRGNS